ncbi:MAG TPA: ABC transporter ATP-binding protein [Nitrososphaerales archaeon]|nr:ABC transporter ATP-binding protein [Nitrososphaerales archaeon]
MATLRSASVVLLEVKGVTKDFGGLVALKGVSLEMNQGEIVGLIGPNGAGKSTLFDIITGIERPTAGSVVFDGTDITGFKPYDVTRMGISRTFQSVRPFLNYTVEENIRVGALFGKEDGKTVEEKVSQVLKATDLESKKDSRVMSLPTEKRKLVEVARALAGSPRLLLLDEPMAGLNPSEVGDFTQLINQVNDGGISVLIVEHVMKAIMGICNRIVVLNAGLKLAEGSPEEIQKDSEVIKVYLGEEYARS